MDGREDVLYESDRTRVSRLWPAGGGAAVIRKQPRGPGAERRLRHEAAMLERLCGAEGMPALVAGEGPADAVLLADEGGVCLESVLAAGALEPAELVAVAVGLARAVAAMHRRGVMHRDITPANVLLSGTPRRPSLIDFDLATTFAEERPAFTHHHENVGTLAYVAPEQTGRTGRAVDQRADLYGLGATLYEAATGAPPFGHGEPLDLIHDHLARAPVPPSGVNPAVPPALSDIILRLLEKEPDQRYQSAEGLVHDLGRLRDGERDRFPLGERDFPARLAPPSRLVGRDPEIAVLRAAFDTAMTSSRRGVLVSGAPGVGKTSLVDELRPIVAAHGGWFVSGKFDQYRRDLDASAIRQALRALARLLLAEPEAEMAALRASLAVALGPNVGALTAMVPEFALLMNAAPEAAPASSGDDPHTSGRKLRRSGLAFLRTVVSPARPVVLVIDDLQWAGAGQVAFVDAVLADETLRGLVLVGAYRDAEVDAAHPLSAMLARWQRMGTVPEQVRLLNLPPTELGALLAEMLRMPPDRTAGLGRAIAARTGGNPYDSVELVNSMRREGALVPHDTGWHWDPAAIRRHLGRVDVVDLLVARIEALPAATRDLLAAMACLGGEVGLDLLAAASGLPTGDVEARLVAGLDEGLLVIDGGDRGSVRFRHDRVQQAAFDRVPPDARSALHLALARRLAEVPDLRAIAAQQYLVALDAVREPAERDRTTELFRQSAAAVRVVNPALAERFLAAALALIHAGPAAADDPRVIALETDRHAALYSLGRLDEADEVYDLIRRLCTDPLRSVEAACVQLNSLTNRGRAPEAVALGLAQLARFGLDAPPPADIGTEIDRGLDDLVHWAHGEDKRDDPNRAEITDPRVLAMAELIRCTASPSFQCDPPVLAWLIVTAHRLWTRHGPCAPLVPPLGAVGFIACPMRGDYRTGYAVTRHLVAVCEARGYGHISAVARFEYVGTAAHWSDPLEQLVPQLHTVYERLLEAGELQLAGYLHLMSWAQVLDSAPTLDSLLVAVEAGLAFGSRTGNDQVTYGLLPVRQFVRALRGDTDAPDEPFDEPAYVAALGQHPAAAARYHNICGLAAAICGDQVRHRAHAEAAAGMLRIQAGAYATALTHVLHGLALADRVRTAEPQERAAPLAELAACHAWLVARAVDAPANFLHLARFIEAERAWAAGEDWAAARAFDAALREVDERRRPWHRALIAERAALFHLAHGQERAGRALLAEARHGYREWGATAKARLLDAQYPWLAEPPAGGPRSGSRDAADHRRSASISSDAIDLLGVLNASRALSSETSLDRLHARVTEILSAMTGATGVQLVLRDDGSDDGSDGWHLPGPAGERGRLPLSVVRYVARTRETLLVQDVTCDDRFARDPYLAGVDCCSLLVVPVLAQGSLRAMLLLENRLSRAAFTAGRLDAVTLIAGQLTVSLDNALLYSSLERKVAERTEALAEANERLEQLVITDALTGLPNRRRLAEVLSAEWSRALRPKTPLAVGMIDIDHFKGYNDHYGHPAGDRCLRLVATTLAGHVRGTDHTARYGGEEFAVVLPDTDLVRARVVAERVRAAVEALDEPHAAAPRGFVTVSIGVAAVVPTSTGSADELMRSADAHLYEAKRAGRNRVADEPCP